MKLLKKIWDKTNEEKFVGRVATIGCSSNRNGGGVSVVNNINFEISATDGNDIVQKVREHAQEISDIMAASLSEAVATVHKNQTLCA